MRDEGLGMKEIPCQARNEGVKHGMRGQARNEGSSTE